MPDGQPERSTCMILRRETLGIDRVDVRPVFQQQLQGDRAREPFFGGEHERSFKRCFLYGVDGSTGVEQKAETLALVCHRPS